MNVDVTVSCNSSVQSVQSCLLAVCFLLVDSDYSTHFNKLCKKKNLGNCMGCCVEGNGQ
jgi:hypothetical protein